MSNMAGEAGVKKKGVHIIQRERVVCSVSKITVN